MLGNLNLKYASEADSSFIVKYFEDFYGEIIRQKALVEKKPTIKHAEETGVKIKPPYKPDLTADVKPAPKEETLGEKEKEEEKKKASEAAEAALPEQIILRLISLLNSQSIDAARYGGEFAAKYYKEAEFIMAALADEIFLHLDWPGKPYWEKNLIESKLYGTHKAGETFFDRLDQFLQVRDPSRSDLAMLYLMALGLGFKGKFRDQDDKGRLAHYRRELFIFINHRDPTLYEMGTRIFPEEYLHTMSGEIKVTYLNDIWKWIWIFAGAGFILLFISFLVWYSGTHSVNIYTESIIKQSKEL